MKGDPDISDLFLYGRLNYYAATDSAYQDKQPLYLAEADTIFAQVAAKVPDNYLGTSGVPVLILCVILKQLRDWQSLIMRLH